jgi:hypothetical protein
MPSKCALVSIQEIIDLLPETIPDTVKSRVVHLMLRRLLQKEVYVTLTPRDLLKVYVPIPEDLDEILDVTKDALIMQFSKWCMIAPYRVSAVQPHGQTDVFIECKYDVTLARELLLEEDGELTIASDT